MNEKMLDNFIEKIRKFRNQKIQSIVYLIQKKSEIFSTHLDYFFKKDAWNKHVVSQLNILAILGYGNIILETEVKEMAQDLLIV